MSERPVFERICFVIDVAPISEEDFLRTQQAVAEVVRELVDDGVQVVTSGMAVGSARDEILLAFEHG